MFKEGDIEAARDLFNENAARALFVLFVAMTTQNAIAMIPVALIVTASVVLFGYVRGVLWSWATSVVGAAIVFLAARYVLQDLLANKATPKLKQKIEENGWMYLFAARTFPFAPTSVINIVAAASSIRFKPYMLATALGNLIYFSAIGLIPLGVVTLEIEYVVFIGLSVLIVVYALYRYRSKRNRFKRRGSSTRWKNRRNRTPNM